MEKIDVQAYTIKTVKMDITQHFTQDQITEMMEFLEMNEHNIEDNRTLTLEMMYRFDYLEEDMVDHVIDYYYVYKSSK